MPPRHADAPIPPAEEIVVTRTRVACDGGGVLGHPLVYMDMGDDGVVECGYCDRRFVLAKTRRTPQSEYLDPAARPPETH